MKQARQPMAHQGDVTSSTNSADVTPADDLARIQAHSPFAFVQLTDLHIKEPGKLAYGKVDTAPYLRHAVAAVRELDPAPSAVVVTGDLVDQGNVEQYRHLQALLAGLPMPVYLLVGNHDAREPLREVFDMPYLSQDSEFIQYAVDIGPVPDASAATKHGAGEVADGAAANLAAEAGTRVRLIALDSLDPGRSGGTLCEARLAWLEGALDDARGLPVVIALHHPPFMTGIGHMDIAVLDARSSARLAEIVARHPNVERIIAGHLHREIHARFAGTLVSTAGSTAHQVCLDLRPTAPSAFTMEPPTAVIHRWQPAPGLPVDPAAPFSGGLTGGLVSHLCYLDRYEGPYPFHDTGGSLLD